VLLLARVFPGPNNGMAYAVAPIEDKYKVVPTTDPLRDAHELQRRGERVLVLYSLSTPLFVEIWQEVREVASKYPVVAGGPHAAGDPITLLKLGVKYVVIGDGEVALPAIVEREAEGLEEVPPNTLMLVDGRVRAGRRIYAELIHKTYSTSLGAYPPIEIMRSCAYRCTFCQTWFHGSVRYRPVENVAQMVKHYVAAGREEIRFIAPVGFLYGSTDGKTPNVDALVGLLRAVREAGGRPYLGLQSGSERLLASTKRDHDVAVVEEATATAVKMGFKPVVDVIAGLPGEEEEDVVATVKAMERLVSMGAHIRLHYFMPLPGTPLWGREPKPPHPLYWDFLKRHRKRVEGYFEEQIRLSRAILETYRLLTLTTPSSSAT